MIDYNLPTRDPERLYECVEGKPPVDVHKLASLMGIVKDATFYPSRFGYSGEIFWKDGVPTVWINPADSLVRQRFTLAHEIGHYVLHMRERDNIAERFTDDVQIMRRGGEWNSDEMQANRFAASLLMPKALIDAEFKKAKFWNPSKEKLAELFEVSVESMGYRLSALGKTSL